MKKVIFKILILTFALNLVTPVFSQVEERERPAEWDQLVAGGRFIDRFLPMKGNVLSSDTWGVEGVVPRYTDNGIEDRIWSYWGGNIKKGEDGKYHLLVCGWLESSEKGHGEWPNSIVFNTVSDNLTGPFKLRNVIGKGHNPEVFQLEDGRYVLYVIDGRYVSDNLNGKWEYGKFNFNPRDRRIIEGLSNLSFAKREDGSFVMVCRGGGIWISRDGLSEYGQLTDKRVYPPVDGRFEDPVIWRDHIQYHMIVNDWLGRTAFYLRSKDGVNWVTDPGEAYVPGIAVHENGDMEEWFKFERIKMYQDEYGRAIQANFAVIDTLKPLDKPFDIHSSKNIGIPLNPGLLLTMPDDTPITS
ncbi:MAG: glycoside hydrolase family protein, partial [Fermentimonas sp.]|nr:glycoside hydrolase family protein [Fermentimonas sp.]